MNITTTYTVIYCYSCNVPFAITEKHNERLLKTQGYFWCPSGHRQCYIGKSKAQELQEKLDREVAAHGRTRNCVSAANKRTEKERRSHSATKGRLTKFKNRVKNGVCPHCNRSFANLKAHMDTKHAEPECSA